MNSLSTKLLICLISFGLTLYALVDKQNELTEIRLAVPQLSKEVKAIHEQNVRLEYALDCAENPVRLLEMARKPEFGHLKYPIDSEVLILRQGAPLEPVDRP